MRRVHQVAAVAVLALGAFLALGASDLRYYSAMGPGPGFFPLWLALILCGLAVSMFLNATFGAPEAAPADLAPSRSGALRAGAVIAGVAGAALALRPLGFAPTMFLVNLFVLFALGRHRVVTVVLVSAAGSFGVAYVFAHWLNVPLPGGDLGAWCPAALCGA